MPLDTTTYPLAHLRLDGRRWNELRRTHAQISTQPAADGSAYMEMGNTKVICLVDGPAEVRGGQGRQEGSRKEEATVTCEIHVAGFSGVDRKRRGRGDKRTALLTQTLNQTFQQHLFTALYPSSTIALTIHVLAQDGSLLAACLNAATLALVDAGVPMGGFVVGCTVGIISSSSAAGGNRGNGEDQDDPLLDLNAQEEVEVPFLTVATTTSTGATTTTTQDAGSEGESDKVIVCVLETKLPLQRIEGLLAVGVDGCKRMRGILDGVVRERGARVLRGRGDGRGGEGEKEGRGEGRMM